MTAAAAADAPAGLVSLVVSCQSTQRAQYILNEEYNFNYKGLNIMNLSYIP